ncbi:MAG TPA: hypothetical protein VI977_03165 [archaeon]|nr:hypothetical protein [archaeon]
MRLVKKEKKQAALRELVWKNRWPDARIAQKLGVEEREVAYERGIVQELPMVKNQRISPRAKDRILELSGQGLKDAEIARLLTKESLWLHAQKNAFGKRRATGPVTITPQIVRNVRIFWKKASERKEKQHVSPQRLAELEAKHLSKKPEFKQTLERALQRTDLPLETWQLVQRAEEFKLKADVAFDRSKQLEEEAVMLLRNGKKNESRQKLTEARGSFAIAQHLQAVFEMNMAALEKELAKGKK